MSGLTAGLVTALVAGALATLAGLCDTARKALIQAATLLDSAAETAPAQNRLLDVAQARAALQALDKLLLASDLSVLQRHGELRRQLTGLPAAFHDDFDVALQQLDLATAHTLCVNMLQKLPQ